MKSNWLEEVMALYNGISRQDDMERYQEYLKSDSKEKSLQMDILETLENLGYPMNENGTYLYKDMIVHVIDELKKGKEEQKLLEEMLQKYSQFYVDVARNELDIGIKSFHREIEKAHLKWNSSNADTKVLEEILPMELQNSGYIKRAYIIGNYIYQKEKEKQQGTEKVYVYQ